MRDFRKLIAWQKAHALVIALHTCARDEGKLRQAPGLRSQLLRAVSSISANIAEGAGKRSEADFTRFLDIALGSAREVENHLLLARDLGCLNQIEADRLLLDVDEVKRILFSLARVVRQRATVKESGGNR